jgi:hypothetical protein
MVVATDKRFRIEWEVAPGQWAVYGGSDDFHDALRDLCAIINHHGGRGRLVDRDGMIRAEASAPGGRHDRRRDETGRPGNHRPRKVGSPSRVSTG